MDSFREAQNDLKVKMTEMSERSKKDLADFEGRLRANGSMAAVPSDDLNLIREVVQLLANNLDLIPYVMEYAQKLEKVKRLKAAQAEAARLEAELGLDKQEIGTIGAGSPASTN
jgi:hypothetical protein